MSDKQPKFGYNDVMRSIDEFFQQTYERIHSNPLFAEPIPIQVQDNRNEFIIEAMLPGIDKKQIRLDIYRHSIRIQILHEEVTEMNHDKEKVSQRNETVELRERVVSVPFPIQKEQVRATYRNGLLKISITNKDEAIQID